MNFNEFHFIRPDWFWAVAPLLLLLWLLWRKQLRSRSWQSVVDARLLPHLLMGGRRGHRHSWSLSLLALGALLVITALAGPAWEKLEQPVFREQSGMVVALDLSRSMDAADVRPSRLERARLKLIDILNQRHEGQTALIAYAATPFVVTPLTSDNQTIISQLPSMTTDLMPAQGSRPDRAIATARDLLQQAGVSRGSVLLITDGVEGMGVDQQLLSDEVKQLQTAGHRLLILGVGTSSGAPIPLYKTGGFLTDANGAIIVPKVDDAALNAVAQQGGGLYRHLAADDSDINSLLTLINNDSDSEQKKKVSDMMSDQWQEAGVWLLLPLLLLAAFGFRRGYLAAVALALVIAPQSQNANAFEWNSLWSNSDQQGQRALTEGDAAKAAQLFTQPAWRSAAQYRAGDYQKSLESLQGIDNADSYYNQGNALAKLGQLPEAINAYDEALKRDPNMTDAKENRDLIKKIMQKQQQQPQKNKKEDDKQGDKSQQQQQDSKDQSQNGADSPQKSDSDGKQSDQQNKGQDSQQQQEAGKSDKQQDEKKKQEQQQQAAKEGQKVDQKPDQPPPADQAQPLNAEQSEEQRANEQWLQRIPDDPGGLWRRKFLYQYQRQKNKPDNEERAW